MEKEHWKAFTEVLLVRYRGLAAWVFCVRGKIACWGFEGANVLSQATFQITAPHGYPVPVLTWVTDFMFRLSD
jgi:hypothetical protein